MWATIFSLVNVIALVAWIILVLLPRKPVAMALVLFAGVGLLCLVYTVIFVVLVTGVPGAGQAPGPASIDYSVEGIRALFADDGAIVLGWTHYLALDLFTGLWIARDADAKGFSRLVQAPILLATFLAGPLGLFLWLVIRERRARASGRWT